MEYKDVKARCLFCEVTAVGNQRSMAGAWQASDELIPWRLEEQSEPGWLWHGVGSPDNYQDFYLCPEHNDPDHYNAAMKWAGEKLEKDETVDFTNLQAIPIAPLDENVPMERRCFYLPGLVPDLDETQNCEKLPNSWQVGDPRLKGCMELAWALDDIDKYSHSPFLLDHLRLLDLQNPLEVAEAMKKATRNIELLTMPDNHAQEQRETK